MRPKIVISRVDAERLENLLESLPRKDIPGVNELMAELERAEIVEPEALPPAVVSMNSTVRFEIESSSEEFELTLVYPKDVDATGSRISILAPVGSALLGLRVGQTIQWPMPGGKTSELRLLEVLEQPEAEGRDLG